MKTSFYKSFFLRIACLIMGLACTFSLVGCSSAPASTSTSLPNATVSTPEASTNAISNETSDYNAIALPAEMKGMWVSFLEWSSAKITTEEEMTAYAKEVATNCKNLGLNTIIVAVRGFSDAFYKSDIFPWSHLLTGTQGQDPGFDPLKIFVEQAHAQDLRLEAMVNPFRAKHGMYKDTPLAATNPANIHPEWLKDISGTTWYNPGIPEVQQLVVDGVSEIVANYDVDGIQFDDYFYPSGIDEGFDATQFANYGNGKSLAEWRRGNISTTVQNTYNAVKAINPSVSFGISPAGNNENNYNLSYADVSLWMKTEGYIDYIMPQIYWGFEYQGKNGATSSSFASKCTEWGSMPRSEKVHLYAGLAAYAIQEGDGGTNDGSEWKSGKILSDMVTHLEESGEFTGFAFFRYAYLYKGTEPASTLAADEISALQIVL